MSFIVNIIWNMAKQRICAFWRLVIQGETWFALLLVTQAIIKIIASVVLVMSGAVSPSAFSDPATWDAIISSPVVNLTLGVSDLLVVFITVGLAGHCLDKRRFADFGFHFSKDWWLDFGFGLALGAFSLVLIFAIEWAAGWVTVTGTFATRNPSIPFLLAILVPLVLSVMGSTKEELLCRGYQLTNIAEGINNWKCINPRGAIVAAMIGSSMIFGKLHVLNPNATLASILCLMVGGVTLAFGYILTGELAIPIGYHITWNFFEGNVFGFPVSGVAFRSATFIAIEQGGPPLWTGGAFGPSAGLIFLGVEVLGMALIVLWVWLRYQRFGLHAPIAAPPMSAEETTANEKTDLQELQVE